MLRGRKDQTWDLRGIRQPLRQGHFTSWVGLLAHPPQPPALLFPSIETAGRRWFFRRESMPTVPCPLSARPPRSPATDWDLRGLLFFRLPSTSPKSFLSCLTLLSSNVSFRPLSAARTSWLACLGLLTLIHCTCVKEEKRGQREVFLFVWKQYKDLGIASWLSLIQRFLSEWGRGQLQHKPARRERADTGKSRGDF